MFGSAISRRSALTGSLALAGAGLLTGRAKASPTLTYVPTEDGRLVRVSIWPAVGPHRGTILFSHGSQSSPEEYLRILVPWSAAGYEILAPVHIDAPINPDHASVKFEDVWRTRLVDMRAVAAFANTPYVSTGHSYGGLIALAMGGITVELPPGLKGPLRDPRAKSVIAFSPPGASKGMVTLEGFKTLAVPALIQTGELDIPKAFPGGYHWHLAAYENGPTNGDNYALLLEGANHWFGGLICEKDGHGEPQPAPLERAVEWSTVFLNAYTAHDPAAMAKLTGSLSDTGPVKLSRK